ncbi:MAG: alpha/beta hydrolase [Dokdonella sp.]|uniref:alpha/beta hydrolase n=1 Tax=Dokdonella sp. TaxID=2291710 RepID=UPI002B58DEF7|nr:alpha/beta fold hydrolase [Xanthomonadales bacterium]HQV73092.1 alpha/beta hydrolase [Dokdonella sp.]MBK7210146.1 alpha/beta fold hydrolase [Xanthomonadales bacterium]MBL0223593.1 alpha/beta fold hydrolase [Xanthomonadales bacterium]HQW76297.1 alpha/beta hydrolase [Dokdonella sp.]
MKKNTRIALAAALAVLAFGYSKFRAKPSASEGKQGTSGQYRIASNVESFRFGSFDFSACELEREHSAATTKAWCAPFQVPENRADANGRKLDLKFALIASTQAADDDFIVYLAGGPGQSAVDTWPQMANALGPARKHRHVLLLDQRGTGASNPLKCKEEQGEDEDALPLDLERTAASTQRCLDEVSKFADPRFYTTSEAVEDLEALRQALGGPKFDLVGVSYGTRVAQQYLKRHPEGVRSIVLDSVAPNELALGGEFSGNLDDALKAQFAYCAKTPVCAKTFPDPYGDLFRLRAILAATPREIRYADPVTFKQTKQTLNAESMVGLVRMFAYAPETAALVPHTIKQSIAGNDAPLLGQIGMLSQGIEALVGSGMQLSVICAEDADRLSPDPTDADTLLGTRLLEVLQRQCRIWPRGTRPADFSEAVTGATPILVLEGELDPVTPPRYGEQVVKHLSNARLIVARGQGHNIIGRGCLPKLVGTFMDTLDPKALDAGCVDELGPLPHFIDFNGAAP